MTHTILLFILVSLCSCANKSKTPTETLEEVITVDSHNSQNSLDWDGVYRGITPCADCSGIETIIELKKDLTYTIKTKYLGKFKKNTFDEKGTFTWDKGGSIIIISGTSPQKYFVGENTLTHLDMDGNKITSDFAEMYILKKQIESDTIP